MVMADEKTEIPQPLTETKSVELGTEQQKLRSELEQEQLFGKSISKLVNEREAEGFTPWTNRHQIPQEYLGVLGDPPADTQLTTDDVKRAKQASFGLALEIATQASEVQFPQGGRVHEDEGSLTALVATIRKGDQLGRNYAQTDRKLIIDEAKNAIARRLRKPPSEIQWEDQRLFNWAGEQFQRANIRLSKSLEAVQAYRNTRW